MTGEAIFIRDYRPGDFAAVDALWQATGLGGTHRGDDEAVIEQTLAHGGRLLLLQQKESGRIVGSAWLTSDGRRAYLHHVGVAPDQQGHGFGRLLTEEAVRIAHEAQLQIKLEVHAENRRAIDLYRRAGFVPLGAYEVWIRRDTGR
jgi:ribosomal protein S18 acetylase RimI-like enzyme